MSSNYVKATELLWGDSLLFTTQSPGVLGTHFIDFGRMKGIVNLGVIQWFWTLDPSIDFEPGIPLSAYVTICLNFDLNLEVSNKEVNSFL